MADTVQEYVPSLKKTNETNGKIDSYLLHFGLWARVVDLLCTTLTPTFPLGKVGNF